LKLVPSRLSSDTPHFLWKSNQSPSPPVEDVTEDFRGRAYPAENETDTVEVQVDTDEDFTVRVQLGERFIVTER
jgi:hypothetical protein